MGRFIVKLTGSDETAYFLEWSTIVDAPVTCGMSLNEFKDYYLKEHGRINFDGLQYRLQRVEAHGTSSMDTNETPHSIMAGNRAGPNETSLSDEEIFTAYCLRLPVRGGWSPFGPRA